MATKKQPETFIESVIAAGFREVDSKGEAVKGTNYTHGWNSLDGRKRHLHLSHKNGKRVELELIANGGLDPHQRIALYDGDAEVLTTHTGVVNAEVLKAFLTHSA